MDDSAFTGYTGTENRRPDDYPGTVGSPNRTGPVTNRDRFGGDLPGIMEKLDYLAALGGRSVPQGGVCGGFGT